MALDPRLGNVFSTHPDRVAARGVPTTPASAVEWPYAPANTANYPKNPNVAKGVLSADAAKWQASRASVPSATAAPAPTEAAAATQAAANASTAAKPTIRAGVAGAESALAKTAYGVGRLGAVAAKAAPALVGADVVSHFNDYKIDDPSVDSSAAGTFKYLRDGAFDQAGRSLSKGALEAGMDLGSFAANTLDYVVPGKAPVSTAYDAMLRDKLGGVLAPAPTAQPTPAAQPKPNLKDPYAAENAAKLAAAGAQPTAFDRSNMSNADVAKVNPQGKVTMTREPNGTMSFSGTDVSGPVSYAGADGKALPGKGLRGDGWGGMNVLDSSEGRAVNNRLAAQFDARIASEIAAAQQAARSAGEASGGAGFNSREARDLLSQAMTKQPGESRADFATRSGAAMKMLGMETDERGNIRTNDTSRRGQDITQSTTLRGQDMDLQGRLLPKQMEMQYNAQMRGLRAQVWQQAGGDASKAAQLWASYGGDAKDFLDMAKQQQDLGAKATEAADKRFEHQAVETNDKGETVVSEGKAAIARNVRQNIAPGYDQMSPEQQASLRPRLEAATNIVNGMNDRKDTSWIDNWLDGPNPALTTLPDLRGAELGTAGLWDGLYNRQVESGDRKITLRDGTVRYVPRAQFNENEFDLFNKSR